MENSRIKCSCARDSDLLPLVVLYRPSQVWAIMGVVVICLRLYKRHLWLYSSFLTEWFDLDVTLTLQDIVALLEDQLKPLVQAELSVLVDVLHRPELLFPTGTEARHKCESGGFISRSVKALPHSNGLNERTSNRLKLSVLWWNNYIHWMSVGLKPSRA